MTTQELEDVKKTARNAGYQHHEHLNEYLHELFLEWVRLDVEKELTQEEEETLFDEFYTGILKAH